MTCVIICYSTNLFSSLLGVFLETAFPSCNICKWAPLFTQLSYCTTKSAVYLFYLQRARLAQSFDPCIPNYCFTKFFPLLFILAYIAFMTLFAIKEGDESQCIFTDKIPPSISNKWCYIDIPSNGHYITSGVVVELFVSIFFGYLFVQPLVRLIRSNEKYFKETGLLDSIKTTKSRKSTQINDSKYNQTQELKKALWYNVFLSILSLSASVLTMVVWPIKPNRLWPIPYIDYVITSVTTFFMLGRNRKYVYKMCCYFCKQNYHGLRLNDDDDDDDSSDDSILSATKENFKLKRRSNSLQRSFQNKM